jgi:hypothetical protein
MGMRTTCVASCRHHNGLATPRGSRRHEVCEPCVAVPGVVHGARSRVRSPRWAMGRCSAAIDPCAVPRWDQSACRVQSTAQSAFARRMSRLGACSQGVEGLVEERDATSIAATTPLHRRPFTSCMSGGGPGANQNAAVGVCWSASFGLFHVKHRRPRSAVPLSRRSAYRRRRAWCGSITHARPAPLRGSPVRPAEIVFKPDRSGDRRPARVCGTPSWISWCQRCR